MPERRENQRENRIRRRREKGYGKRVGHQLFRSRIRIPVQQETHDRVAKFEEHYYGNYAQIR